MQLKMGFNYNSTLLLAFLILLGVFFVLELNTSLKTQITFGDEGFHARMAQWISENKEYPIWTPFEYTPLSKSSYARPPLFNILEASFLFVFGNHEIILKAFPPLLALLVGISVFLLAKRLFNIEIGIISSLVLVTLPSFVTYSVLTFDEMLLTFFMSLFALTFAIGVKEKNRRYLVLSALFAGLTFLTKHAGIIILLFVPILFLYSLLSERKFLPNFKNYLLFGVVFLLVTTPFLLRNFYYYGTPECQQLPLFDEDGCVLKQFEENYKFEVRTLAGGSENELLSFGLQNFINFAYGNIWFILIGFFGGLIALIKHHSGETRAVLLIMLFLGLVALYQTSSRTEDTVRQLLPWTPFIAIVSAIYWNEIYKFLRKYQTYLGLAVIGLVLFFGYQSITSKLQSMENVKTFSPLFFEACDWVKENLDEDVRLMTFWGHRAAYSCQRTIAAGFADIRLNPNPESIRDFSEMHGITHFFIQKFSLSQQPSRESYSVSFVQLLENNPEIFKPVYENGPPLDQCLQQGGCDGNIIYEVIYDN
ncbi:MAG: glycosyltransferase family 39 protein [Candidatus Aenigmarchaeota archaeon]|nr:glycosyltransferase family 39 protein [Candidatus Aenigmarchaeota archaeon]